MVNSKENLRVRGAVSKFSDIEGGLSLASEAIGIDIEVFGLFRLGVLQKQPNGLESLPLPCSPN